jgi:dCTP deaminase
MILSGQSIRRRSAKGTVIDGKPVKPMLDPFAERTKFQGLTYGVGPSGYDVRLGGDLVLPPGGFILGATLERFAMPDDLLGIVHDKSTWARLGLALQNTVIEPGWEGYLTLELTNHSTPRRWWQFWLPHDYHVIRIVSGTAIAQIIFHVTDRPVEKAYDGKYHHQKAGPQPAI